MTVALILKVMHGQNMKITSLTMDELNIPFKHSFTHASATRNSTETIIVKVQSITGLIGFGEGCPRSYVTGESIKSATTFFEQNKVDISQIKNLSSLKDWVDLHQLDIDKNPAAWCAIELAILDLLGREECKPIERLLSQPALAGSFQYTAILGVKKLDAFKIQLQQYLQMGFTDFKIKITGDLQQDKLKIDALRELTGDLTVRLDANNLWSTPEQALSYINALDYDFFAIEEPLHVGDYAGCTAIHNNLDIPVILDESFLRVQQFDEILNQSGAWIINIRISKMGGIVRSLQVANLAKEHLIPIIVGAQVGESSILTRAALTVANTFKNNLVGQEGAYGTHLLKNDVADPSLMFEKGGKLNVAELAQSYGSGICCNF